MRGTPHLSVERKSELLIARRKNNAVDAFPHRRWFGLRNFSHSFIVEKNGTMVAQA